MKHKKNHEEHEEHEHAVHAGIVEAQCCDRWQVLTAAVGVYVDNAQDLPPPIVML